jgi:uncharacterized protein YecT (DUF1311 family)
MSLRGYGVLLIGMAAAWITTPARSQSFDCGAAKTGVERAICATADLRQRDADLATAYAAAQSRGDPPAEALRQTQRDWLRTRDACLADPAGVNACLASAYDRRIAALAPLPLPGAIPSAAASLDTARFPTAGEHDTLLHVTAPGRFAIRADSPTGTGLQLVDMMTGPGPVTGGPSMTSARINALLDVGTYKLRAFGEKNAQGETSLSVAGFADATPPRVSPGYAPDTLTLTDLHQQSFWIVIGAGQDIRFEAAGRSLADLRLWRDGRDLVAFQAQQDEIAPDLKHPMTRILLAGRLPPGTYLVTAYGGPPRPWSDGADDQPLYVRSGRSQGLLAGGGGLSIGVFGREVYAVPQAATLVMLTRPQPVEVTMRELTAQGALPGLTILRNQRSLSATLALPPDPSPRDLEVTAASGTAFTLRSAAQGLTRSRGQAWFEAVELAHGGDEAPAAALIARVAPNGTGDVLASPGVPAISRTAAWRTRFNLRGRTTLLFHATEPVTVAVHADGPPVEPKIATLDGAVLNATSDGRAATRWSLSAGWYHLVLDQTKLAEGILDLTLGPPGLIPPSPAPSGPPAPVLPLGVYAIPGARLRVTTNQVPNEAGGVVARDAPVELTEGPLVLTLAAGEARSVEVHAAKPGTIVTHDIAGGPPMDQRAVDAQTLTAIALPAADRSRTIAVAWLPPDTHPAPSPRPPADLPILQTAAPAFLDLARGQQTSFVLQVAQGGLFRTTTLGRLHTRGAVGTAFVPDLDSADGNGIGANMLIQRYLRAGRYRLDVTAIDSSGRLAVTAAPAPMARGETLLPGLSVRASLPAGSGIAFPLRIAEAGTYHMDLLGLGGPFAARLEDDEGWPLLAEGSLTSLDRDFVPGTYRLMIQPPAVAARAVVRLTRIVPEAPITGHGPHNLPFEATQPATWREPAGPDAPRVSDTWTFTLRGPAQVTLDLTGDGMIALLHRDTIDGAPLGRVLGGGSLAQSLPAGRYVIEARATSPNDRLDYSLTLHTVELQPATPRMVDLPSSVPFAIAEPRVVSLTSFGTIPVRAVLHAEDGHELARAAERADDWNIALSRPLPAGRYRLDVSTLAAPAVKPPAPDANADSSDTPNADTPNADSPNADNSNADSSNMTADQNANADADQNASDQPAAPAAPPARTQITLALAEDLPDQPLRPNGSALLAGAGVHHLPLPPAAAGTLMVAAAEAPIEVTLAVEAQGGDGAWHRIGQDQSTTPLVAIPADGSAWRALVWSVDGADVPIRFAAAAVQPPAQALGELHFQPLGLPAIATPWSVALLADPGATTLDLSWSGPALRAAATARDAAEPVEAADPGKPMRIFASNDRVWLVAAGTSVAGSARIATLATGRQTGLDLPAGGRASLPMEAANCGFVASAVGVPGLSAGRGMGVATDSAFALCGGDRADVWNAGGSDPLRITLRRDALTLAAARPVDLAFAGTIAPHTAQPLRLPVGTKRIDTSLAAGSALVAGWNDAGAVTVWAGGAALSRSLTGDWTDVLAVNTTDAPVPVALIAQPVDKALSLPAGAIMSRFFGADGSFALPLDARTGQRLHVAGDAIATVLRADGQVRTGGDVAIGAGPATAVIAHKTGALAIWLEGDGASPFGDAPPRAITLPAQVSMNGAAMALRLSRAAPALLHMGSSAPLLLALGEGRPALFGQGVALSRYIPAGNTVLRLLSPLDGPLTGTLELTATPVTELAEGVGAPVAVGSGSAALFGFHMADDADAGIGVRADPDTVAVRLLDDSGQELAHGVTLMHRLKPGHYLIEARVPPGSPTTVIRPAVLGTLPHATPPPADLVRNLLIAAGFTPPSP